MRFSPVVVVCVAVIACAEAEREPAQPTAAALIVSPDSVSFAAGSEVQLSAQVNDEGGRPIPGAEVTFSSNNATLVGVSGQGLLTARGPTGSATVEVAAGEQRRRIPVTVTPGQPAEVVKESGDGQSAPATRPLPIVVAVVVRDARGNVVPGARVRFAPTEGSAEPSEAVTSATGVAETRWTLGATAGEQNLQAGVEGARDGAAARFSATAQAGPLARIAAANPPVETAEVATVLRPRVRTTDEFGNPQPGTSVLWDVTDGGGALARAVSETDADGVAEAEWQLGSEGGANVLVARAAGLADHEARFEIVTKAGPPARLVEHDAGQRTAPALRVVDAFGNPVPAVLVRFAIVSGGGTVSDEAAMTDDQGVAAVERWEPASYPAALEARISGEVPPLRFDRSAAKR